MIIKNANYSAEKDADLNIISAAINFTNVDERTGSQVYGRIAITNEQAKQLEAKEIMPADVIEPMLIDILGIGIDEDDVARFVALEDELKTKTAEIDTMKDQITEKDAEIARLNDALMEMVLMISNLTIPQPEEPSDTVVEEPEEPEKPIEPPIEDEPVEEVEEDGEIITDDSDMGIDPIDTNTEPEGGEGGE